MNPVKQPISENLDPAIVDSIVRRVLERLGKQEAGEPEVSSAGETVRLEKRVVTLEAVRDRLSACKVLVVPAGAIVTPAVKDELNARGICLQTASSPRSRDPLQLETLCVARLSDHFVPVDWLKGVGSIQVCCGEDYHQLAEQIASQYASLKTICFAAQPHVAVVTLNRNRKLRAAHGRTEKEIAEINSTLGANVLVLDAVQSRQEQLGLIRLFSSQRKGAA